MIICFASVICAVAEERGKNFTGQADYYFSLDNGSLINEGVENIRKGDNDNAQMALSVVVKRYMQNPDDSDGKGYAIQAYYNLGILHSTHMLDYNKAYRYLKTALKIAEEDSNIYRLAYIHTALANLYSAHDNSDSELEQRHIYHLIEGAKAAIRSRNQQAVSSIGANLVLAGVTMDSLREFMPIIEEIGKFQFTEDFREKSRGTLLLIDACRHWISGEYARTEEIFKSAIMANESHSFAERYRNLVYEILSHFYMEMGDYEKGIAVAKENFRNAESGGLDDFSLSMSKRLHDIYASVNQKDSADKYFDIYLHLKERMSQKNGFGSVKTLDFLDDIERINAEIDNVTAKFEEQKRLRILAVGFSVMLLIIVLCLLWVYYNLRKNHRILFKQNEQMQQRESQHRLLRNQWDKEKNELINIIKERRTPGMGAPESDAGIDNDTVDDVTQTSAKVNGDTTCKADDEKEKLLKVYASVLSFMDNSREIYTNGFTLADLCRAIGISRQSVSKAINVCFGDSFPQLLNEYRIREVTRLMNDENSDNLTIEAMAEMAGFKSRTSFTSLFKNKTGLTPSEYLKIKRNKRN
jgi:AraC-like DNA-binding protein/cell fate (sporulation/competence/biofilm development) regulator YlbF (YheA/YmcA/DUF963 family)